MTNSSADTRVLQPSRRLRAAVLILTVLLVLALAGGFVLLRQVMTSPEQRAASAAELTSVDVTAPVTIAQRQEQVVLQGTIGYADSLTVSPPAIASGDTAILVSLSVKAGSDIHAGELIGEVSGQPLVALSGSFPFYRDLTTGDEGNDVKQLQRGLRDLGRYNGSIDGRLGAGTERAVTKLITSLGYPASTVQMAVGADSASSDSSATAPATPVFTLPRGIFTVLPTLPARVLTTPAPVGADLAEVDTLLTVTNSAPVVTADISTSQATQLATGQPATISLSDGSQDGTIASVQEKPGADGMSTVTVTPGTTLDESLVGQSASTTIVTASTDGEVPTVPIGAIHSDADGDYVLVPEADTRGHDGEPSYRRVAVTVTQTVDGAAVIGQNSDLPEGTEVLVSPDDAGAGASFSDTPADTGSDTSTDTGTTSGSDGSAG